MTDVVSMVLGLTLVLLLAVPAGRPGNAPHAQAVKAVRAGKRKAANAAWWGFDEEDATEPLQAAISSGARRVIVPNLGQDWIVRPLTLAGDQELVLEEGVVITAKRGEYRGGGDSVLTARDLSHLTIRGYGATVRMQKEDYMVGKVLLEGGWQRWFGQYEKAEWRMPLSLQGCCQVEVCGLTLCDSGGDGIIVGRGSQRTYCQDVHIKDVVCRNNYRQGISVISAEGLVVENSVFQDTWGTPPSSGVDLEPDSPDERLREVIFRNCRFEDNYGDGIEVFLAHLTGDSVPVSIRFEQCRVSSRRGAGIRVTKVGEGGPDGLVEFRDCVVENTEGYGIKVQDKCADRARVRFDHCTVRNAARNRGYAGAWAPVWLHARQPMRFGGIDFLDCRVEDDRARPALALEGTGRYLYDVTGEIAIDNPLAAQSAPATQPGRALVVRQATGEGRETDGTH